MDGSQIKANKFVVSTLSPNQLAFDLIGEEYLEDKFKRRIELIENEFGCLMWYTFAIKQAPKYGVASFNPDIDDTFWLGLAADADPMHVANEAYYSRLRKWPPLEDWCPTVWCHSLVDPLYAPDGYHTANKDRKSVV